MAQDCYKLFKTVYAQAIADNLAVATAAAVAQTAMQNCLAQQATQSTSLQTVVNAPESLYGDPGPTAGQVDRATSLGNKANQPKDS